MSILILNYKITKLDIFSVLEKSIFISVKVQILIYHLCYIKFHMNEESGCIL